MNLRWEEQYPESWWAYSGDLRVGMVVQRSGDERYAYSLDAVHTRHIAKGNGDVASASSAKRAVEKAWAKWLAHAKLEAMK